ncbi:chloride channel protein [Caloramator quimbayensis]
MENVENTQAILSKMQNIKIKIVFKSIVSGIFSGFLVVLYRIALEKVSIFSHYTYNFLHKNLLFFPLWIILMIMLGYFVGYIIEKEPMASGSGIPQVEGMLLRKLNMNWIRIIIAKFVGGLICIGAGLSLGREGPSIQLGACAAQGVSKNLKSSKIEEEYLITGGASAGLSAAFSAPLAGVIFALEEVHKNFSPIVLVSALSASIVADFISKYFFGMKPIFYFFNLSPIPLKNYPYIILLGIILGLLGVLFNKSLLKCQDLYAKQNYIKKRAYPIIPFILAGFLGLLLPEVLGGGHEIVVSLMNKPVSLYMLLIILFAKFLFTMISYGSGAPGGIFLPLLSIGALIGAVYGNIMHSLALFNSQFIPNIIILSMAGYFSAIVKAPITGIILITEMSGGFNHLLSISIVCLTSYIVVEALNSKPIYEVLLERLLSKGTDKIEKECKAKIIIEAPVCMSSLLEGKKIKDIKWPSSCLLVAIRRGEKEIIPKGNTVMYAGDYIIVLADENNSAAIKECLCKYGQTVKGDAEGDGSH